MAAMAAAAGRRRARPAQSRRVGGPGRRRAGPHDRGELVVLPAADAARPVDHGELVVSGRTLAGRACAIASSGSVRSELRTKIRFY